MIEETASMHVDESKRSAAKEECEQMQDWELSHQIEQMIEVKYMELEQEPRNEETYLMPRAPQVIP